MSYRNRVLSPITSVSPRTQGVCSQMSDCSRIEHTLKSIKIVFNNFINGQNLGLEHVHSIQHECGHKCLTLICQKMIFVSDLDAMSQANCVI